MNQQIIQFNIYCDESRVENIDSKKMVIGALFIPRVKKKHITIRIKKLFQKYKYFKELKWTNVDKRHLIFYKSIIDFFVKEKALGYRCIVVDKSKVKYEVYHENDQELAFFKFYYLMLRSKLIDNNQYFIFLDKKPTRDKNRARSLHSFLNSYILIKRKNCNIKHLQAYSSQNNLLIQLSDFFTGLMGYACNDKKRESAKYSLDLYLREKLGRNMLCRTTLLNEEKFNVLVWNENL